MISHAHEPELGFVLFLLMTQTQKGVAWITNKLLHPFWAHSPITFGMWIQAARPTFSFCNLNVATQIQYHSQLIFARRFKAIQT